MIDSRRVRWAAFVVATLTVLVALSTLRTPPTSEEAAPPHEVVGSAAVREAAPAPPPAHDVGIALGDAGAATGTAPRAGSRTSPSEPTAEASQRATPALRPGAQVDVGPALAPASNRIEGSDEPGTPRDSARARFEAAMALSYEDAARRMRGCAVHAPPFGPVLVSAEVVVADYQQDTMTVGHVLGDIPAEVRACIARELLEVRLPAATEGRTHRAEAYAVRASSSVEYRWNLTAELAATVDEGAVAVEP